MPEQNTHQTNWLDSFAAPHGLSRYLETLNPLWNQQQCRAKVIKVQPEARNTVSLHLRCNRRWKKHLAGQHIQVSVYISGVRHTRCYSVSCAEGEQLRITVKAHADGFVSKYINESIQVGDVLDISPAQGEFLLPRDLNSPVLLIAGGSGITPLYSMAKTLLTQAYSQPICLLYYLNEGPDQIFAAELANLSAKHSNFEIKRIYMNSDAGDKRGLFEPSDLEMGGFDFAQAQSFLCGPAPLMNAVQSSYDELGLQARLHSERFKAEPLASGVEGGEIQLRHSERLLNNDGRNLLEQLEDAGLKPEHGCRMGICNSCSCQKLSGRVRDLQSGQISDDGPQNIRLCVSAPEGDVQLDI